MTIAYSYIRFSSLGQQKGRSYDRQAEAAREWCAKHGHELSEDRFTDRGKSGYTAEHLGENGQLKRFLDLVEAKVIEPGSYLIVESLDRLSREKVNEALPRFMQLLNAGINIVTLLDGEKVYTKDFTPQDVIMSVFVMARANEESDTKSKRAKDKWQSRYREARETGKAVKMPLASWLTYGADGAYVLKEPEAGAVRLIFEMCIAGHGMVVIAKALTIQGHRPFRGEKWITATVLSIVKNKAAMGVYTPRDGGVPVEAYFPAVVSSVLWFEAQGAILGRKKACATRQTSAFNVWQGIAKCWYCNSALHCLPKGRNKEHYLVCSGKIAGICTKAKNTRLDASEEVFKELLAQVESLSLVQDDKAQTAKELTALEGKLDEQRQQHQELGDAMARRWSQQLDDLAFAAGQKLEGLFKEKAILESKLAQESLAEKDKNWFFNNLDLVSYEKRGQANALLKRLEITVTVSGGKRSTYIVRKGDLQDTNKVFPNPQGKAILQISDTEEGVIVVPLTSDQRTKNAELDPDGIDRAKANKWIRKSLGLDQKNNL